MCSLLGLLLVLLCLWPGNAAAETTWFAKIVSIQGSVEIKRKQETAWKPAATGDTVAEEDMLKVGAHSRAALLLRDQGVIRLDQNTMVTFRESRTESRTLLELLKGALHFFSTDPTRLKVITPFANAAIEGTEFAIRVTRDQTELSVLEGKIRTDNAFGAMLVDQGQSAVAGRRRPPELRLVMKPRDAVHWTLYYPPVIDPATFQAGSAAPSAVGISLDEAYRTFLQTGDANGALAILERVPANQRRVPFLLCRSAILLAVGSVEEAEADLQRILARTPEEPTALALKAVIALTRDDKKQALELAERAVRSDPASAAAQLALSYGKQAQFQFDEAVQVIRALAEKHPHHALAWARLSDLELGQGRLPQALQAADRAAALNPHLSMVQTVLGFAYLTMIKIDPSEAAFQEAIRINPVDPLPRLGLGLAEIRRGNLPAGREHLEIAVALDPLNSLLRSYLGKAYYEEKREHKAGDQLRIAKQLDPNDPTPWFYDAILKQSINRPIEALHDLQESIARNDNRAVYRSRLLLDQDLAARSASLARIYSDVGFEQLALVEGWRSLNTDPTNFSAHRFLADSYGALPRHEIARVSELLQAQLLQPININPLQPQLAESDLSVFRGAGPASAGFNEYSSLFTQNGASLQASTVFGENSTFGDELVVSGIRDNVSFSLGQYYYRTDGFRENNDLTRKLYNAFLQADLSPQTSLQAEYRYNEQDYGDLALLFYSESYRDSYREDQQIDSIRLGLHHVFSPRAHLLGSVIYRGQDGTTDLISRPWFGYESTAEESGWSGEAQFQYRTISTAWITGLGYYDGDTKQVDTTTLTFPFFPPQSFPEKTREDASQGNFYLYSLSYWLGGRLTATLGASYDKYEEELFSRDQFNPKLGLSFDLSPQTTVRAAAFRTLKRRLLTNQTIEPTQVAGFNQFFDDINGTSSWLYGIALDHRFRPDLFGGIEFSKRELDDVPYTKKTVDCATGQDQAATEIRYTSMHEQVWRAYLYWAARKWLSLTVETQIEDLDHKPDFAGTDLFTKLRTVKIPFGLNFYHPSGISLQLKATLVDQTRKLQSQEDSDQFMVLDAALSYRMPKRLGIITFGVKNLWDQGFNFQDTDPANPDIYPERMVFGKLTLVF